MEAFNFIAGLCLTMSAGAMGLLAESPEQRLQYNVDAVFSWEYRLGYEAFIQVPIYPLIFWNLCEWLQKRKWEELGGVRFTTTFRSWYAVIFQFLGLGGHVCVWTFGYMWLGPSSDDPTARGPGVWKTLGLSAGVWLAWYMLCMPFNWQHAKRVREALEGLVEVRMAELQISSY